MQKNNLMMFAIIFACIVAVSWFCGSIEGVERSYKVKPEITLTGVARSDAGKAIDAYERLMNRFIDLTESSLTGIGIDVEAITKGLISINYELTGLSARLGRIEKALGIEEEKPKDKSVSEKGEKKSTARQN